METSQIVVFQDKKIRRIFFEDEWYFSVIDIVELLTDSKAPRKYWDQMKRREASQLSTNCRQLKLPAANGKMYKTDCASTKNMFRIIQSIPSPKAEPFKQWLAQVGYERVQEIENPELAQERMKQIYEAKGYPKDWIDKRMRGIAIRQNLTDEWQERGITEQRDFAILTAEISKATFGVTPSEYRYIKGLTKKNQNLRDHMSDLELIFTMLGERVTTEYSQQIKPETFEANKRVARSGGTVAGNARRETEELLGRSVVTADNFLDKNPDGLVNDPAVLPHLPEEE